MSSNNKDNTELNIDLKTYLMMLEQGKKVTRSRVNKENPPKPA